MLMLETDSISDARSRVIVGRAEEFIRNPRLLYNQTDEWKWGDDSCLQQKTGRIREIINKDEVGKF